MMHVEMDWDEIREQARLTVAEGYKSADEVLVTLVDRFELPPSEFALSTVQTMVAQAVHEHAEAQAAWPDETDCDRLDRAFAVLESIGVVARQNFSCCPSCGRGEIQDEISTTRQAGRPAIGYVFFHMQQTESAVNGHGLHLIYGPCLLAQSDESFRCVGRIIAACLRDAGLRVEWDEDPGRTIRVEMRWQRRRPGDMARAG